MVFLNNSTVMAVRLLMSGLKASPKARTHLKNYAIKIANLIKFYTQETGWKCNGTHQINIVDKMNTCPVLVTSCTGIMFRLQAVQVFCFHDKLYKYSVLMTSCTGILS